MSNTITIQDLTKADYVISKVRKLLDEPFEYFLEWAMASAFNGAVFSDRKNTLQILCFPPGTRTSDDPDLFELHDMQIGFYMCSDSELKLDQLQLREVLSAAEAEFHSWDVAQMRTAIDQVARLHLRVVGDATNPKASEECDELIHNISVSVPGRLVLEPPHDDDWFSPDIDSATLAGLRSRIYKEAELVFDEPREVRPIVDSLRPRIPIVRGTLFGQGQVWRGSDLTQVPESLLLLSVFARHF